MEARPLSTFVGTVLARAWRRESALHGETHWRCVAATGLELASEDATVDRAMVFCFGPLHDTRRVNDAVDPEQGARAAQFAEELRVDRLLQLGEARLSALIEALRLHSDGQVSPDPTIGTCWDADRAPPAGLDPPESRAALDARCPRASTALGGGHASQGRPAGVGRARRYLSCAPG